jgi:hypothetical protein
MGRTPSPAVSYGMDIAFVGLNADAVFLLEIEIQYYL